MTQQGWNFEKDRISDYSPREVVSLVKPLYNSVTEEKIKLLHHGSFNVYQIDDFIFRIPDKTLFNSKGYNLILDEVKKLEFLKKYLSVAIPNPVFISENPERPLVGYKKISGESLENIWPNIPKREKNFIANRIATFLNELHSSQIQIEYLKHFKGKMLTTNDIKKNFEDLLLKTKKIVFPLISHESRVFYKTIFEEFFEVLTKTKLISCVTHQDFDLSNILIDPDTFKLTGIIDFEDMSIGDPAYDLIFISQGEEFFKTLINNYTSAKDRTITSRIKFYYKRTSLPYFIYGIEHNLPEMVTYGKYLLEKRMNYSGFDILKY